MISTMLYYFALDPLFPPLTIDAAAAVIIHRSLHLSKQYFGAEQNRGLLHKTYL